MDDDIIVNSSCGDFIVNVVVLEDTATAVDAATVFLIGILIPV